MSSVLYVALGGAIGASARHLLGQASLRLFGPSFPVGTFSANLLGSFLMGLLIGYLASKTGGVSQSMRLFLGVGLLGGFTTFSAFSLEAFLMLEKKAYGAFTAYVGGSVIMGLAALVLGLWLSRHLFAPAL